MAIRYVVNDEHTLGYINDEQPDMLWFLRCSVLRGSPFDPMSGGTAIRGVIRDATVEDFDAYGVMPPPSLRKR